MSLLFEPPAFDYGDGRHKAHRCNQATALFMAMLTGVALGLAVASLVTFVLLLRGTA